MKSSTSELGLIYNFSFEIDFVKTISQITSKFARVFCIIANNLNHFPYRDVAV